MICHSSFCKESRVGSGQQLANGIHLDRASLFGISQTFAMSTEKEKMLRGELNHAFVPELVTARSRCKQACNRFNNAEDVSRRRQVELWKE